MEWWKNAPLLISAVQCKFEDDDSWTLNEYVAKSGFNTEQLLHLTGRGHMAYYDEARHGTRLDAYLKEAAGHGIREIIYYNTHCLTQEIVDRHPDWMQRKSDGSPMPAYSIYYLNCVNGGWFDDFASNIRNLCRHPVDGIFLDGPVMREDGCFCETCRELFVKRFGKSIEKGTRMERQAMRVDSVTEFIRKTNAIVKEANPGILLYMNNSALRADITGSNSRKVEPYVDMIGAEGGFVRADHATSLWSVGSKAKHIETIAGDKPTVTFVLGNQSSLAYYMHGGAETTLLHAQACANGSNVWYGMSGSASRFKDSPGARASVLFNGFVNANSHLFRKSKTYAKVALMWSQDTANNYSASVEQSDFTDGRAADGKNLGDHYAELMGFYDILTRAHIQFDIIDEAAAAGGLSRYGLVILPDCACMDPGTARALAEYVRNGGSICATFDTGFYDGQGKRLEKPALAGIMGIESVEKTVCYPHNGTAYQLTGDCPWLFEGLWAKLLPNPLLSMECVVSEGAKTVSTSLDPMPGVYAPLPTKGFPGIILNEYGKGHSVYITGAFGVCYADRSHADYARIIKNIVERFSDPVVRCDCPGLVEMVLRRRDGLYVLHMINLTGAMTRPVERTVPLYDLEIRLSLGHEPLSIEAARGGTLEDVSLKDKEARFRLSRLDEYEVIAIPVMQS
ncbi:MAG: beta-galactosidase trimerization domain-containing protein [Clostridia bacterium]|nr:beta-galactosidase trimerization domain-containing protein [Clostridia bacterium]